MPQLRAIVEERLAPGGVVVGNLWDSPANDRYEAMVRGYQVEFDRVWVLEADGNRLVVGVPGAGPDRATLRANAAALSRDRDLGLDLPRMAAAITDITAAPLGVEPLTDDAPAAAGAR